MNMGGKVTQMTPGSTFHADWDGAWDDATMRTWTDNSINKLLNCSAADLGNETMMQQDRPLTYRASPRLVPISGAAVALAPAALMLSRARRG